MTVPAVLFDLGDVVAPLHANVPTGSRSAPFRRPLAPLRVATPLLFGGLSQRYREVEKPGVGAEATDGGQARRDGVKNESLELVAPVTGSSTRAVNLPNRASHPSLCQIALKGLLAIGRQGEP